LHCKLFFPNTVVYDFLCCSVYWMKKEAVKKPLLGGYGKGMSCHQDDQAGSLAIRRVWVTYGIRKGAHNNPVFSENVSCQLCELHYMVLGKERLWHNLLSCKRNVCGSCERTDEQRFAIKTISCGSVSECPSWHTVSVDGWTYCRHCCNNQLWHGCRQAKRQVWWNNNEMFLQVYNNYSLFMVTTWFAAGMSTVDCVDLFFVQYLAIGQWPMVLLCLLKNRLEC